MEKTQVFATCHYDVLTMPGFFSELEKSIGHFQIEQSIEESWNKRFKIWFWTDEVEIKEGEIRRVDIIATRNEDQSLLFKISKP